MAFKAILWDCDGCLIDSELIACALSAETFTAAGYPISTEDFVARFCGQGKTHIFDTINKEAGFDLREKINDADKTKIQQERFSAELKAIDGIHDVLDQVRLPMAIASGSEFERLEFTLKLTNLYDRFMPHIYSASLVKHGKPSPDIFLYAAEKIGVAPADCLVIEDSANGVRSGKAAGITVFGFSGGSHIPNREMHEKLLTNLGADLVFHEMKKLPDLMTVFSGAATPKMA